MQQAMRNVITSGLLLFLIERGLELLLGRFEVHVEHLEEELAHFHKEDEDGLLSMSHENTVVLVEGQLIRLF